MVNPMPPLCAHEPIQRRGAPGRAWLARGPRALAVLLVAVAAGCGSPERATTYYKVPFGRCVARTAAAGLSGATTALVPAPVARAAQRRGEGTLTVWTRGPRPRPVAAVAFFEDAAGAVRNGAGAAARRGNAVVFYAPRASARERVVVETCLARATIPRSASAFSG